MYSKVTASNISIEMDKTPLGHVELLLASSVLAKDSSKGRLV
jgi:hypothetical protein